MQALRDRFHQFRTIQTLRIAALTSLFGVVALAEPGWTASEEEFGLIRSEFYDQCLEALDRNAPPEFRTCDRDNINQIWFLTRAHVSDHFGERAKRQTTRSAAYPEQCLTEVANATVEDQVLELRPCTGAKNQSWQNNLPNNRVINLRGRNRCVSVSQDMAFVRYCSNAHKERRKFDIEIERVPSNFDIGRFACERPEDFEGAEAVCDADDPRAADVGLTPHRFALYAVCELQNQEEQDCFINYGDGQQYGFNYGSEPNIKKWDDLPIDGYQTRNEFVDYLLDLGDRYSADRCALAHDRHYWHPEDSVSDKGTNNFGFFKCLENIHVTTRQELTAVDAAEFLFGGPINAFDGGTADQACFSGFVVGSLPPAGQAIDSCHCRQKMGAFRADYRREINSLRQEIPGFFTPPAVSPRALEAFRTAAIALEVDLTTSVPFRDKPEESYPIKCSTASLNLVESWIDKASAALVVDRETPPIDPPANSSTDPKQVQSGDTVWSVWQASDWGTFDDYLAAFRELNPGVNPDLIYAGQSYRFPSPRADT